MFSGYEKGLIAVFDAFGDGASGLIARGEDGRIEKLRTIEARDSLGMYYSQTIDYLGFRIFDEYKVMGLAPYGDPNRFRSFFREQVSLNRDGNFSITPFDKRFEKLRSCCPPRKKGQPIEQIHKDIVAALQESLENIVMHVLSFYRREFSLEKLCLAGGVTHNCTMNGKIAKSGLFDSVFVQPAAHDAGSAMGAAYQVYLQEGGKWAPRKLGPIYFGHDVRNENIAEILERWSSFLSFEKVQDVEQATAQLLADGYVAGWVQGKSEFGPRALGNRSIIADPRPMENRDRINAMVKKREGFRPFAPSVIEEAASTYFEIPGSADGLQYMIFVVDVKEDQRQKLGAVTHVNGSARVQSVSQADNPRYWKLIKAFGDITGVPVVLNTSFNNHAEPIVDTVTDAITSFLTTELDYLVIGDFVAKKKKWDFVALSKMNVTLPKHVHLCCNVNLTVGQKYWLSYIYDETLRMSCTKEAFEFLRDVLEKQEHGAPTQSLSPEECTPAKKALWKELFELWSHRFVMISPAYQP
jgi:carbamoyltransferase